MNKLISFFYNKLTNQKIDVPKNLTKKEKEVFFYILDGLKFKEIGQKMNVKKGTVSFHASNIYKKTKCTSRQDLTEKYKMKNSFVSELFKIGKRNRQPR